MERYPEFDKFNLFFLFLNKGQIINNLKFNYNI